MTIKVVTYSSNTKYLYFPSFLPRQLQEPGFLLLTYSAASSTAILSCTSLAIATLHLSHQINIVVTKVISLPHCPNTFTHPNLSF